MGAGRSGGTLTVLDGTPCTADEPPGWCAKVLAVGGVSASGYLDSAEVYDPDAGTWKPTGGTRDRRWLHKAVGLPSGKVLVVGGGLAGQSAELYDPDTGRWTPTSPPLVGGLREFNATVLSDGRVLVTGGQMWPAGKSPAQIYDPVTNAWSVTTPLTVGRYNAVAVRLADGRVLVAGGSPGAPNGEVYDPVLMTWTPTGPLATPVATSCEGPPCNTATLLASGDVLVTGGDLGDGGNDSTTGGAGVDTDFDDIRKSSQLFDPDTLQWRLGPKMNQPRMKSTATPLGDGRVLLAGGAIGSPHSATGSDGIIDPAEIYNPVANTWTVTGAFVEGRGLHDAVLLDGSRCRGGGPPAWCGQVLAVGGARPRAHPLASAELFDPVASTRPPSVLTVTPRAGPASGGTVVTVTGAGLSSVDRVYFGTEAAELWEHDEAAPDSKITVVAPAVAPGKVDLSVVATDGSRSPPVTQASFTFYPAGEWTQSAAPAGQGSVATLLTGPGCADVCGRVLISGGPEGEAWLYDPVNDRWEETGKLNGPRFHHTQTLLADGRVLVVGGQEGPDFTAAPVETAEVYDPAAAIPTWAVIDGPAIPRRDHTATLLLSGHVLVTGGLDRGTSGPIGGVSFGGQPATAHAPAEIFDPATNSWTTTGELATGRANHRAILLVGAGCATAPASDYCGKVLVAGGIDSSFRHLRSAEVYDPATGTWTDAGTLGEPRVYHTMTLVSRPGCDYGDGSPCVVVLVTGGYGGPRPSSEIYDPVAGSWRVSSSLNVGRADHAAVALANGTVLVAGGESSAGTEASVEIVDPWAETSTLTGPLLSERFGHFGVSLPDGRVLIAGGCCAESSELYESTRTAAPPSITSVEPVSGSTLGGTRVSLRGRGLSGRSVAVAVDGVPVTPTFLSESRIDFITPPHPQGEAAVTATITRANGDTEAPAPAEFTYGAGTWRDGEPADGCTGCRGRYLHTATPLPDGKVLVAGGTQDFFRFFTHPGDADGALRSAQVLDPTTGKWSATLPMASGRHSHSATALGDGTILVVGGQDAQGNAMSSSELYDPTTPQPWKVVGSLTTARFSHTATLLDDGRVLVVGGAATEQARGTPLSTAEVYDPEEKTWSPAGSLSAARVNHTASALPEGKVLVAGGIGRSRSDGELPPTAGTAVPGLLPSVDGTSAALASTEIFDPSAGSWQDGPPMAVARFDHSATVLSGHACSTPHAVCGDVLVAGGNQGGPGGTISTELFDPDEGKWSPVSSLRAPRAGHAAVLLPDGTVLVAGGGPTFPGESVPGPLVSAEVFDPAIGWRYTTALAVPRAGMTLSVLPDGDVVAVGGYQAARLSHFPTTHTVTLSEPTEIYRPAPRVFDVAPRVAAANAETLVTVTGTGMASAQRVLFGEVPAVSFEQRPPSKVVTVVPRQPAQPVEVAVVNSGGTSSMRPPNPAATLRYIGGAGEVVDLAATALSESEIELSFTAPDDGTGSGPATRYIVKQARTTLDSDAAFDAAQTVIGPDRVFDRAAAIKVRISDLEPSTTYHYALRPLDALGVAGPRSNLASATTKDATIAAATAQCADVDPDEGAVAVRRGYSLVGLPGGTRLLGSRAVFSWFDQGAGGAYVTHGADAVVESGRGYWAYYSCPQVVALSDAGIPSASLSLDGYHASMVGNPSGTAPASVTGHDFAARWDPSLNAGAGGYHVSGYREALTLSVGEGLWVFSYEPTAIALNASSG